MATTTNGSSIINFVKKYPIILFGFSLLFMPSVHRLLLYFTPLLLSTAIFILAMLTWGPSATSSERGKRRGARRNEWAFNGSLKIYEDEEEEEEDEEAEVEVTQFSERKISDGSLQREEGKASKKLEAKLQEPDPDSDEESHLVGTGSNGATFRGQAEPDPGDGVETVSNGTMSGAQGGNCAVGTASNGATVSQSEPADLDLQRDHLGSACVGTASYDVAAAEPDPDLLHEEQHVESALHDQCFPAAKHLHAATPDHHQHDLQHGDAAKGAPKNPDQEGAGDHLDYHDAEPDHLNYHDAEVNHIDNYDDAEPNHGEDYHDAEPDPDLHEEAGEAAKHAESEGGLVENDDLHAAIFAELRQKLGDIKRMPYSEDVHSVKKFAESWQTLQAVA